MVKGKLNEDVKLELEKKLRTALYPSDPNSKEAKKRLKYFLKPEHREFDKIIGSWEVVPKKDFLKQVELYHRKNTKD